MPGEFDMNAAVESISADLFDSGDLGDSHEGTDILDRDTGDSDLPGDPSSGDKPAAKTGEGGSGDPSGDGSPDNPDGTKPGVGEKAPGEGEGEPQITDPKAARLAGELPPEAWTKENQAKWKELPEWARKEVAKREEDMFRGIESYKQDANFGKNFQQVLRPHAHLLQHFNVDPFQITSGLLQAHVRLSMGTPEQKVALARQILQDYNIDMQAVAAEPPYESPEVKALREENQRLQSETQNARSAATAASQRILNDQLDAFEADPKNVYFKEVATDMLPFLRDGLSLEVAYERAVWANPATRAKEQARVQQEAAAKKAKDDAERAAKARQATSANVRTSARGGSATAPLGSMDDTLKETLAGIRQRG